MLEKSFSQYNHVIYLFLSQNNGKLLHQQNIPFIIKAF